MAENVFYNIVDMGPNEQALKDKPQRKRSLGDARKKQKDQLHLEG
jgi:hypothetical protein